MSLETGVALPRFKGMIRFGDVLTSELTHDIVVMFHEEQKKPIAKLINKDIWWNLEEFVSSWGSYIEISHNVNYYGS